MLAAGIEGLDDEHEAAATRVFERLYRIGLARLLAAIARRATAAAARRGAARPEAPICPRHGPGENWAGRAWWSSFQSTKAPASIRPRCGSAAASRTWPLPTGASAWGSLVILQNQFGAGERRERSATDGLLVDGGGWIEPGSCPAARAIDARYQRSLSAAGPAYLALRASSLEAKGPRATRTIELVPPVRCSPSSGVVGCDPLRGAHEATRVHLHQPGRVTWQAAS